MDERGETSLVAAVHMKKVRRERCEGRRVE